MPDVRQYAEESLAQELSTEPVFAKPEREASPLGDEIVSVPESPPMDLPEGKGESAELATPKRPSAQAFNLPLGQSFASESPDLPLPSRSMSASETLSPPKPPMAVGFDLPLGNVTQTEIEPLRMPQAQKAKPSPLPLNQPKSAEDSPLSVMMQQQQKYSEMSMRDFMAEHEWEELPMPKPGQADYEPFPLPERTHSPEARLETPFVPPPGSKVPPTEEPAGFSKQEVPFSSQESVNVTADSVREQIARDRHLYNLSQE